MLFLVWINLWVQLTCNYLQIQQVGEQAIRQEIALQLYDQNIFTFGQVRRLANLSVWEFQQLLGQQKISRHYTEMDLADDIGSIKTGSW